MAKGMNSAQVCQGTNPTSDHYYKLCCLGQATNPVCALFPRLCNKKNKTYGMKIK